MKADETKRKREILLGINPCIYGLNYHDIKTPRLIQFNYSSADFAA